MFARVKLLRFLLDRLSRILHVPAEAFDRFAGGKHSQGHQAGTNPDHRRSPFPNHAP